MPHDFINAPYESVYEPLVEAAQAIAEETVELNTDEFIALFINELATDIHTVDNAKWWTNLNTGEPLERTVELLMTKLILVHSEVSEAVEGARKDIYDTHLTDRKMVEVELAGAVIRIFDVAAGFGYDLGGALTDKRAYNRGRADHKAENRLAAGGKQF